MTSLTKQITDPQNLSVVKPENPGITDVGSTSGYIQHGKMPLLICILNLHATINKRKPYRSFKVVPDTIWNENRWVVVTSSIHEPPAIVTSYWPIILTLFLWRFHHNGVTSQQCFSPAVRRHCIFRSVLFRFRGRMENYQSCVLHCGGLCCHSDTTHMGPAW